MRQAVGPLLATLGLATAAAAQAPPAPAPAPTASEADWRAVDPQNTLVIDTTKGRVVVELRPEIAPVHVARIKALARQGFYDGSLFYRVIKGFMAQTGDKGAKQYRSSLPNMKGEFTFALKPATPYGSIGTSALGDLGFVGAMPVVVTPDPSTPAGQAPSAGRGYALFCPGTTAFAHGTQPDSANSQIFLMRGIGGPTLEKKFTAFGRILQGQEAVEAIRNGEPPPNPDKITRMRVVADLPAAERPKLQVMDTRSPAFAAEVQATMQAKGAAFTLCDVTVPVR